MTGMHEVHGGGITVPISGMAANVDVPAAAEEKVSIRGVDFYYGDNHALKSLKTGLQYRVGCGTDN